MTPIDIIFIRRLLARLDEERQGKARYVLTGKLSHDDYTYWCGYLKAFEHIELWSEELRKELLAPENN